MAKSVSEYTDEFSKKSKKRTLNQQKITISVIGGHNADKKIEQLAQEVGAIIGKSGAVLVCGGLGGVMKAAAKGAKEVGGLTIGLLPGREKSDANEYIDIALPTTIGFARNAMVAGSADIIVALSGSYGTESEICYGLVYRKPVIDLGGWNMPGMIKASNIQELKAVVENLIKKISKSHS